VLAILATLVGTILIVICIGSMGLTYYLVSRRTREIGVRRALGATRGDVVRYFVVENVILTLAGVVLGLIVLGIVLPRVFYEQEAFEMSWPLVIASIAIVVVLNLIATLIPARKAATVPPVVASRSA
jgi:putative ABC transport system permease protein